MRARRIVLASGSPRRRELLAAMGIPFEVLTSDVDETVAGHDGPADFALQLARRKAQAVAGRVTDALVIGGDTVVELDGTIFGKPADEAAAFATLGRLSGRAHRVVTGLAVLDTATGVLRQEAATSTVRMRAFADDEIRAYVASGEPFDKAGAYAVQGLGGRLVAAVDGDLDNVIGLPTRTLRRLLAGFGVEVSAPQAPATQA
ncbi:Maf family protein [Pseudofrankia inefficax]|uniref:dTTP/UTP pyrophosphatase n=1 Tax=Pseudofrankia inefficax (strain DSM 45817 / CECT 9037 / DDB 130130 / EuI1c) TaxID=298654 RepID=E3J5R2_PSEI1|nr:Maf family protein [Pseudofrankia inefficax]ADP83149.1 maf protein [Pseudofrankia inefficax]